MSQRTDAVVVSTIGIDTGKNTLHLVGLDDRGSIVCERKLLGRIRTRFANVAPCLIGIEAARELESGKSSRTARHFRARSPRRPGSR
jgi:hypothetical protein